MTPSAKDGLIFCPNCRRYVDLAGFCWHEGGRQKGCVLPKLPSNA